MTYLLNDKDNILLLLTRKQPDIPMCVLPATKNSVTFCDKLS